MKDDAAGEVPVAFVVRSSPNNDGDDDNPIITENEIKEFISKQVIFWFEKTKISFNRNDNRNGLVVVVICNYWWVQVIFYKRIKRVFFVEVIPKSPSGKILRKDLRARLAAGVPN